MSIRRLPASRLSADHEHGVQATADAVEAALRGAGFEPEWQDQTAGLTDIFHGSRTSTQSSPPDLHQQSHGH
jgi:hypothetical protein